MVSLCRQQGQVPITVLLMFTDIGQEVQHANQLLIRLNQWKQWCQVNLVKIHELFNTMSISSIGWSMANASITKSLDWNTNCTTNLLSINENNLKNSIVLIFKTWCVMRDINNSCSSLNIFSVILCHFFTFECFKHDWQIIKNRKSKVEFWSQIVTYG